MACNYLIPDIDFNQQNEWKILNEEFNKHTDFYFFKETMLKHYEKIIKIDSVSPIEVVLTSELIEEYEGFSRHEAIRRKNTVEVVFNISHSKRRVLENEGCIKIFYGKRGRWFPFSIDIELLYSKESPFLSNTSISKQIDKKYNGWKHFKENEYRYTTILDKLTFIFENNRLMNINRKRTSHPFDIDSITDNIWLKEFERKELIVTDEFENKYPYFN